MTQTQNEQPKVEQSALEKRLEAYKDGLRGLNEQIAQLHRSRDMQLGAIEAIQVLIKEEKEATNKSEPEAPADGNVEKFPKRD